MTSPAGKSWVNNRDAKVFALSWAKRSFRSFSLWSSHWKKHFRFAFARFCVAKLIGFLSEHSFCVHRGLGYRYPRKSDYEDLRVKMRLENPIAQNDPRISDNFDRMSAVHPWSKLTHLSFKTRALSINFISELTGSCMVWIIAWNKTSYEKRGISRAPRRCPRSPRAAELLTEAHHVLFKWFLIYCDDQ